MLEAVVTGVCAIVAAVLSATVTKYGWSFWWPAAVIRCRGYARELSAITPDGKMEVHDNTQTQYTIRDGRVRVRRGVATVTGHLMITDNGSTLAEGRMKGMGPFQNGYAYLQYTVHDETRNQSWHGLCLLRVPGIGDLTGYWITDDNLHGGHIAFGEVRLSRG